MVKAARTAVAALGMLALVFTSVVHICGHQGAFPGNAGVSVGMNADTSGGADMPDGSMLPSHHCGACLGIVLPEAVRADVAGMPFSTIVRTSARRLIPYAPALHTPPPKSLT